jgi:hypothetical protein
MGMERNGMTSQSTTGSSVGGSRARVVFGLMVILFGAMAMLEPIGRWLGVRIDVHIWPFILMFLGLARIAEHSDDHGRRVSRSAVWLILVGLWGLVNEYRIFGLDYAHSWPLLVICAGSMIVWHAVEESRHPSVGGRRPRVADHD